MPADPFPFGESPATAARFLTSARWEADLSDGAVAVQQGDGADGDSCWLRLKAYCAARGLGVTGLRLRFRSHVVTGAQAGMPAYLLRTGVAARAGGPATPALYTGHLDPTTGLVHVVTWLCPELFPLCAEWRDPADPVGVGPSLIPGVSAS